MEHLEKSINILREDPNIIKKTLIGGFLLMASILILPYFVFYGYTMKILRKTGEKELDELPKWDDWDKLFIDGLIAFLFSLIISIPIYIIMYLPIFAGYEFTYISWIFQIIGSMSSFIMSYILFILLALLMREGHEELTNFSRIKNIATSKEYIITYLIFIAIGIGFGIFALFFVIFTLGIGLIALPFLYFLLQFILFYMIGRAITIADDKTTEEDK